jgi:CRP/FNR family cyclic AMP-dependent transcriptional regulator
MHMDFGTFLGLLGVGFSFASFVMKSMRPLRAIALVSNVCFIGYGYVDALWPTLMINGLLVPVNAARLWQINKLTKEIAHATQNSPISQWLLPHMQRRSFKAGEVLFRRGDAADKLIYIADGELRLVEIDKLLGRGELIGEIGLFAPDKQRTQTLVAESNGQMYFMTDEMMFQLYFQNPRLGFYFMRLIAGRLLKDLERSEGRPSVA